MPVRGISLERTLWHGIGSDESWKRICAGDGLKLPAKHAHDPGDYGRGIYFTDSLVRAKLYAHRIGKGLPVVQARVRLQNALVFDWTKGSALDASNPAVAAINALVAAYGDPVRGTPQERARAAERWRLGLLGDGVDGIVARHVNDTEIVVYDPPTAILRFQCKLVEAQ